MTTFHRRLAIAAGAIILAVPAVPAQHAEPGPRWRGFIGCFTAMPADEMLDKATTSARIVCITPSTSPDVAVISAVADGKLLTRDSIDASGRVRGVNDSGCAGTQTARWSADGRRVFLRSSTSCQGIPTEMSAILAVTPAGDWVDIRRISTPQRSNVRVAKYRDVGLSGAVPPEIADSLRGRALSIEAGRLAAGAPVGTAALIEAARAMDSGVVIAWIAEGGQRFAADRRALSELAGAGVSAAITDAVVSSTEEYVIRDGVPRYRFARGPGGKEAGDWWDQGTGMRRVFPENGAYDPWGVGIWTFASRYGALPVGYGLGNPIGFGYDFGQGLWVGPAFGWWIGYGNAYGFLVPEGNSPRTRMAAFTPPVMVLKNDAPGTESVGKAAATPDGTKGDRTVTEKAGETIGKAVIQKVGGTKATSAPPRRQARDLPR